MTGPLSPTIRILGGPLLAIALLSTPTPARADEPSPSPSPPAHADRPSPSPSPSAHADEPSPPPPAQPTRVRLAYRAPAGCPDEPSFVAAVAAQARPFVRAPRSAARVRSLEAIITLRGDGHAGVLRVREAGGATSERTVAGDTCAEVFSALALVAALTVDTGPPPPNPPPVVEPPPPPPPPPRWRWSTAVTTGAFFAIAPVTAWGVAPTFEAAPPLPGAPLAASLGLSFVASPRSSTPLGSAELFWLTARFGLTGIALGAGPFSIRPAADIGAGIVRGRGLAIANPRDQMRPWVDATVGARAQLVLLPRVAVELSGGILVPITRVTWIFEDPSVIVHDTPPFGGYLTVGLRALLAP